MDSGAVRSVNPILARVRLQDVPVGNAGSRGGKYLGILAAVRSNLEAGLAPNEALEIQPQPNWKTNTPNTLLTAIKKMIAEKKYAVDAFTREKDGHKLIYIVGR